MKFSPAQPACAVTCSWVEGYSAHYSVHFSENSGPEIVQNMHLYLSDQFMWDFLIKETGDDSAATEVILR